MGSSDYIRSRTTKVEGEPVRYRYNIRTRLVTVTGKGIEFTATSWDSAPFEIREQLAPAQASTEPAVEATAPAAALVLPNVFRTSTLTHELVYLADGTPAPKCRNRPTNGTAEYSPHAGVPCNSCSGAHLSGRRLG